MKPSLNFEKKGNKVILTDVNEYSIEEIKGFYNTFKTTLDLKKSQLQRLEEQLKLVNEEIEIMTRRFNDLLDFLKKEKIEIEENVKENSKD